MANVSVIQRHAHLAGAVKLEFVNGREGKIAKAVLTAISNTRRASRGEGEGREEARRASLGGEMTSWTIPDKTSLLTAAACRAWPWPCTEST